MTYTLLVDGDWRNGTFETVEVFAADEDGDAIPSDDSNS
jgi:hypothetical protein